MRESQSLAREIGFLRVHGGLGRLSPLGVGPRWVSDLESSLTGFQGERKGWPGEGLWREEKLLPKVRILDESP